MVSGSFDAIKVGTGEDLVTLTRWVIAQQQVNKKKGVHISFLLTDLL